ncbi:MAG: FeoA family protein [Lachnospiraceae bacterium]
MIIPLNRIHIGQTAKVVWIASEDSMAARLEDLGFIPGNEVSCVLKKNKHGMQAFLVRNAVIALRHGTCGEIFVECSQT